MKYSKSISLALMASAMSFGYANAQEETESKQAACSAITDLALYRTEITSAEWQEKQVLKADPNSAMTGSTPLDQEIEPHCLVKGIINSRTGADGKPYGIQFELRLPATWNNKFLFQGGGGLDGFVAPALGSIPSQGSTAIPALIRGYAVVSQNSGHEGMDPSFGQDQQARLDYAYASTGQVTTVAKQVIEKFYGQGASKSYFMGCSNGGREAMIAAERYPTEFDGIIAGNPGFRLSFANLAQSWDSQQFMSIAPENADGKKIYANALTEADLNLVSEGVITSCDEKDGLKDGIINAWEKCDFTPSQVQCAEGQSENCLTSEKVEVLNAVFSGAKNSNGENIYASWPFDAGVNTPEWRIWKLGNSQSEEPDALTFLLGAMSLGGYFMYPSNPEFNSLSFDFDKDVETIRQTAALNDAISTNFSTFEARGGKMIIFHGVSDPVFSANDIRDWYLQLQNDMGDNTQNFARLYMVPGMTHCGGGSGLDDFDPLTALEQWTDAGTAPDELIGKGKGQNEEERSQPICAYPRVATYTGGDENDAASFKCQ